MKTAQIKKQTPMSQAYSLWRSLFSKKISGRKKLMAVLIILYIVSPIDLIPDFVPFVGYADDVLLPILLFLANKFILDKQDASLTMEEESKN